MRASRPSAPTFTECLPAAHLVGFGSAVPPAASVVRRHFFTCCTSPSLMRISNTDGRPPMDERIHFIYHQGKKILLVDLSKCPASEFEKLVRQVPDHVMVQPLGSVLALTDFAGAVFNRDAIRAVKETAVFDKPYIKKSALVGTETFPKDFYEELKSFSRRDLLIFRSRDEALAWLVADSVDG